MTISSTAYEINEMAELSTKNRNDLYFLIRTEQDLIVFINDYWNGLEKAFFAIRDFRELKVRQRGMKIEEFLILYEENKKNALEELFQHPVCQAHIVKMEQTLVKTNKTLIDLYNLKQENIKRELMRLVLSTILT